MTCKVSGAAAVWLIFRCFTDFRQPSSRAASKRSLLFIENWFYVEKITLNGHQGAEQSAVGLRSARSIAFQ